MLMCSFSGITSSATSISIEWTTCSMMPPFADARRFALELDGHFDRDLFAGPHAEQIDVEHLLEERVPLDVLQQRLAVGGAVEVDDLRAVAQRGFDLVGGEREADRFFAVAVQDGRQLGRRGGAARCCVYQRIFVFRLVIFRPW